MKRVMLALIAVAVVGTFAASAEAGGRYRRAVRRAYYAPVVVRPRYVAPVHVHVARPVVVARPVYVPRRVYVAPPVFVARPVYSYGIPAPVHVPYGAYYGGGVHVHTPGLGLHISY